MTKAWLKHKDMIGYLYKDQGKTLEETMKIMKTEKDFNASTRAYRAQFKKWGWTKYNKQQRTDEGRQTRPSGVAVPHEAPLMTPVPSSDGGSGMAGPAVARAVASPISGYTLGSLEMDYSVRPGPYRGGGHPSNPALTTPTYSHHPVNQQPHFQSMQQSFGRSHVPAPAPQQHNGGAFGFPLAYDHVQLPFQQEQQLSSYRQILPVQQHYSPHRSLHVDTRTADPSTLDAFLSPIEHHSTSNVSTFLPGQSTPTPYGTPESSSNQQHDHSVLHQHQ